VTAGRISDNALIYDKTKILIDHKYQRRY